MSGFDPGWLALREPVDHRSIAPGPRAACARHFEGRDRVAVLDLGAGTGSNLRASWAHLPDRQDWRLVDHDPALLDAARRTLAAWGGRAATTPRADSDSLVVDVGGKVLSASFEQVDLMADVETLLARRPDLVTAAAFFDLVSNTWIDRFVDALAEANLALYTVLIYNGTAHWDPAHPADHEVSAAFNRHQTGDKGFGPSAGPQAAAYLIAALRTHGYAVETGDSPWRLTPADDGLTQALADGIGDAVSETGLVAPQTVATWRQAHRLLQGCEIGHVDLFARPAG